MLGRLIKKGIRRCLRDGILRVNIDPPCVGVSFRLKLIGVKFNESIGSKEFNIKVGVVNNLI